MPKTFKNIHRFYIVFFVTNEIMSIDQQIVDSETDQDLVQVCSENLDTAMLLYGAGNLVDAKKYFNTTYLSDPKTALEVIGAHAVKYMEQAEYDKAKFVLETTLSLDPTAGGDTSLYFALGTVYAETAATIEAIDALFDKGIEAGLDSVTLMEQKAMVFEQMGFLEEAFVTYESLYEFSPHPAYSLQVIRLAKDLGWDALVKDHIDRMRYDVDYLNLLAEEYGFKEELVYSLVGIDE